MISESQNLSAGSTRHSGSQRIKVCICTVCIMHICGTYVYHTHTLCCIGSQVQNVITLIRKRICIVSQ